MVFCRKKFPNWGLNWREKVGFEVEKENWAVKTRGELIGEPKRPRPDLRDRENGLDDVKVVGEYENLKAGPEENFEEREKQRWEEEELVVVIKVDEVVEMEDMKGWLKMEIGILAFMSGFWGWSSWSFKESFIVDVF